VAVLIREALSAYLADTATPADHATPVQALQEQLAALTQRVEALEQAPLRRRQRVDTPLARIPGGQPKLTPRQITLLRAKRARGVPIKVLIEEFAISRATLFRYLK
jgi:hypothetical protein